MGISLEMFSGLQCSRPLLHNREHVRFAILALGLRSKLPYVNGNSNFSYSVILFVGNWKYDRLDMSEKPGKREELTGYIYCPRFN